MSIRIELKLMIPVVQDALSAVIQHNVATTDVPVQPSCLVGLENTCAKSTLPLLPWVNALTFKRVAHGRHQLPLACSGGEVVCEVLDDAVVLIS